MSIKLYILLLTLWTTSVLCSVSYCSKRNAILKKPAYDFSVKLLQRLTEDTDAHFVHSPIATWLQLAALAEGAEGTTLREIWNVTKHHRNKCFKRKLSEIITDLYNDIGEDSKRHSIFAMDSLMGVKKKYVKEVQKLYGVKIMQLNFDEPMRSAAEANDAVKEATGGMIDRIFYYDDFMSTVLLISDANYFKNKWKSPFNSAYTKPQPFYSRQGIEVGKVNMMNQIGYFNLVDCPHIDAQVLEIPCATDRISMLLFLPSNMNWIGELFYRLQRTRLTSIFNLYKREKPKLVNLIMPKFKQRSEVDNLPELIYDMGVKRIFNPSMAELKGISKYKIYASLMTQISEIEVNEEGVRSSVIVDFLVKNSTNSIKDFNINRPFAYMIVDRITELILFAGVYSEPSLN